jgi:hypothetical protein
MNEYQRTPNENGSTRKRQSRRRFLAVSAGTAIGIGAGPAEEMLSAQTPAPGVLDETTIVLVNGKIHTFDAANSIVNTVTIRHNRIVSVGGPAPKAGPGVRIINLRGRTVVPGLVEPHIHIVSLGNRPGYHTILENTTSIREVQEALAARRKDAPEGAWIRADQARSLALQGHRDEALAILEDLQRRRPNDYVDAYHLALLLEALGRREEAFKELERAYEENSYALLFSALDAKADPFRSDSRFERLQGRMLRAPTAA